MAKLSKFFRVAVEGATTDGRVIERSWLTEAAAAYNRETYAARVNMEHIRGITADKPFRMLGDVMALKTEDVEIELGGKKQKKLGLFAQIEPNDDLLAMNANGQKLYTSIEIAPSFADTKKAYLVGLAVTDSPASLGTELLSFAAGAGEANPLAGRKQHKDNLFTAAEAAAIELEEEADASPTGAAAMFAAATAFFTNFGRKEEPKPEETPPPPANDNAKLSADIAKGFGMLNNAFTAMSTETKSAIASLRTDHNALKASIENTDANPQQRRPADGRGNFARSDF